MTPSETVPDTPRVAVPSRSALIAALVVFVAVTAVPLIWLAGRMSGIAQVGLDVAVLLITASLAALFVFRRYQLALEGARYVVEDQAFRISRHEQAAPRGVPGADPKLLAAARQEIARLGEELGAARKTVDELSQRLAQAPKVFAPIADDQQPVHRDALTGLPYGVAVFEQALGELIAETQSSGAFHGVLMIGLDQLESVLDGIGPVAGDEYIWTLAQLIADNAPSARNLYRVSAKHFALLLPAASDKQIRGAASRIIGAVAAREFSWGEKTQLGAVSVGALSIGLSDVSARDIVERAFHALLLASAGDHLHVEAMLPMLERRSRDQSLRDWLEERLDHHHQRLAAQVIVPVDGKAVDATWNELLLRIEDDDGVWLPPEHYVDVLERLQITSRIDHWVLQNALCKKPPGLPEIAAQRRLSINIFGSSLARDGFLAEMRELLAGSVWPTGQLCFEIDEATVMQRPSRVAAFISATADFGCQFAIDRYRGIAGLAALRNFPVSYIKLHDSLLARRNTDVVDRAQLEWLIRSAHLCGAKVVAVGIRDDDMLARARELKVDFVQGYALAPPSPWNG